MTIKVILNPYANRWRAKAQLPAVQAALDGAGLRYELVMTERAGQGVEEARRAIVEGCEAVVAAGGDSTVNEVVNGLIQAAGDGATASLGVLPLGTANDFSDMLGLTRNLVLAARVIADGASRPVDVIRLEADGVSTYFVNNSAAAMEPMVTLEAMKIQRLSGTGRYVAALVRALAKLKAWQMEVVWDGGSYQGPVYLLDVCNSPRTGGIYPMAPGALLDDGLLDMVLIPEVSRLRVLVLLAALFRGKHVAAGETRFVRTTQVRVTSKPPTPVHTDGEIIGERVASLDYQVLPGKLRVLSGASSPGHL